jgi:diguanylate cyclase (GGDEF)-like protein
LNEDRPRILVVDDEPTNLELLERMLRRRYAVRTAASGAEALEILRKEKFAAILSDQRMPNMTGTQFLAEARRLVPDTVRMILTGYAPESESLDAINVAHVSSFLTKPVAPEAVERAVADAVEVYTLNVRNQHLINELHAKNSELAEAKRLLELSLDERTQALLAANQRLEALALRDPLTGLYNHRFFQERIAEEIERRRRYGGEVSLVICDIDNFRLFNEEKGHPEGDKLIVTIAHILSGATRASEFVARIRPTDMVARYGGEEFAILVPQTAKKGAAAMCERIRQTMKTSGQATLSFGVAESPGDAEEKQKLIDAAERALRKAKELSRDRVELY